MKLDDIKKGIWFELSDGEGQQYNYQRWLFRVKDDIFIDVSMNINHRRPEFSVSDLANRFWVNHSKEEIFYSEYPDRDRKTANRRAIEVAFKGHTR